MKRENAAKRYYKKTLGLMLGCTLGCLLLVLVVAAPFMGQLGLHVLWMFGMVLLVFIPFDIYYLVQYNCYSKAEFEHIQTVPVQGCDTLNYGRYGSYVGFIVTVEMNGFEHKITTKHCHRTADEYVGRDITVGFFSDKNEWIVLE